MLARLALQDEPLYKIASFSSNTIQGTLLVGCFRSLTAMIAPEVIFDFSRAFDKVDQHMVEGDQQSLIDKLHTLEIDVALSYDLRLDDEISFEALDGKRLVRLRLVSGHRPMLLGLTTCKPMKPSRLAEVFMQRCRPISPGPAVRRENQLRGRAHLLRAFLRPARWTLRESWRSYGQAPM